MPKWLQTAIGICTLTAAIFGGIIYFATAEDLKRLEKQTVLTFEMLQNTMEINLKQNKLDALTVQKYRIREEMRRNPADPNIKQDYQEIKEEIVVIEKQLEKKK